MTNATKEQIINDLYTILFVTDLESAPDNHDVLVLMCKALLDFHGLHFKEFSEIPTTYTEVWAHNDVEAHFFDTVCPGIVPSLVQFEYLCNRYFDFEMWEQMQSISKPFEGAFKAMQSIIHESKTAA